jgi:hypothetical protein
VTDKDEFAPARRITITGPVDHLAITEKYKLQSCSTPRLCSDDATLPIPMISLLALRWRKNHVSFPNQEHSRFLPKAWRSIAVDENI